jgi:site-specific DNA-cytosine methylase
MENNNLVLGCDYRNDEGFRFRENGKSGTLAARARNDESCGQLAKINTLIRRLTPLECERLQTVPDNYTNHVSDSQRYKMLGNGWTVDVISYIFSYIES